MEELNYYDLENIMKHCVEGNIDMHEPIEVTNKLRNKKVEISLLKHFLIVCKSENTTLIHILSQLRYELKLMLLKLVQSNQYVNQYIQHVINEWSLKITPEELLQDGLDQCNYREGDDLIDYETYLKEKLNIQEGGNRLIVLQDAIKQRQDSHKMVTKDYADKIQKKIQDIHTECSDCVGRIKHNITDVTHKHKLLDPLHRDVLLDLSTKAKSTYLEFLHKQNSTPLSILMSELQDLDIPDNIHTIFLNYVITLNMIKKELYYISNSYKYLLHQMNPHMESLSEFMEGTNPLESLIDKSGNDTLDESSDSDQSNSFFGFSFF